MASSYKSKNPSRPDNALRLDAPKAMDDWDPPPHNMREEKPPISSSKSAMPQIPRETKPQSFNSHSSDSSSQSRNSSIVSVPSTITSISLPAVPKNTYTVEIIAHRERRPRRTRLAARVFRNLPISIYENIARQLKAIHTGPLSQSCHTCYLRDLCSLSLTSRAWDKVVVRKLYEKIELIGHDSGGKDKKHRGKIGARLKILRRTLRGRMFLANLVRHLKVPCLYTDGDVIPKEMIDLVASVVMACPMLEKLDGLYPIYSHEYDRLTHALSTRRWLKEHIWLIGENNAIAERSQTQLTPGLMDLEQKSNFVNYHNAWSFLTTLLLYAPDQQGILEKDVLINHNPFPLPPHPKKIRGPGILQRLPSLQNLGIANFDMDDFDDATLQLLPSLQSLRLQNLEGVTFWGISEFTRTRAAFTLRNLSLINLDITYISAISNVFLHLKNLKRLTLVQDSSPETVVGEPLIQPIMASSSIRYIHWEIPVAGGTATSNLAASIRAGGFPRLRTLRCPTDHDGELQSLCRPRALVEIPSDWSGRGPKVLAPRAGLRQARRTAQRRIEEAWTTVMFKVVVEDHSHSTEHDLPAPTTTSKSKITDITNTADKHKQEIDRRRGRRRQDEKRGTVLSIYDLNGFMGTIGSNIEYYLEPDVEASDYAVMDFADVVGAEREDAIAPAGAPVDSEGVVVGGSAGDRGTCNGSWNSSHPSGPKWWSHTPRPRYAGGLDLMKFF